MATIVADEEPAPDDDESLVEPMSFREFQRMMEKIRVRAARLRDTSGPVGGRMVTDKDMLTGV